MKTLDRWNAETGEYEPYGVPESWRVVYYAEDMDARINCASCGHGMTYGKSYTSSEIYARRSGFGYAVCEACYHAEVARKYRLLEKNHWKGAKHG